MIRILLSPLGMIYWLVVAIRNFCYDSGLVKSHKLNGRTISVGNIGAGGTGKSPIVESICQHLISEGFRPAVLTRGYKSGLSRYEHVVLLGNLVVLKNSQSQFHGDEPRMLANALPTVPIVVGANRVEAAKAFLESDTVYLPTHWLLDDGFQHRQIYRDFDLVLLDSKNPFAGGLMPWGRLREPVSALKRATCVLFTRPQAKFPTSKTKNRVSNLCKVSFEVPFVSKYLTCIDKTTIYKALDHSPALLVAGIENPAKIIDTINEIQIEIADSYFVGDHKRLDREIIVEKSAGLSAIVTTAKDYWRDPDLFAGLPQTVFVLSLIAEVPHDAMQLVLGIGK